MERLERGVAATAQWRHVAGLIIERAKQPKAQTDGAQHQPKRIWVFPTTSLLSLAEWIKIIHSG
jgi:hypothetical protein